MGFWEGFLIVGMVHLLAAMSPGPDFVLVTKESLTQGKKAGLLCALGISLGLSVHIIYSAFGLATVIAHSTNILFIIKIIGGSYLIYLGYKSLTSKYENVTCKLNNSNRTSLNIIKTGVLCNVLNPKAPLYFVSLFTIVLSPNLPIYQLMIYGIWIMFIQFFWFGMVALTLSSNKIQKRFLAFNRYINYILGGAMIALGVKVLSSKT